MVKVNDIHITTSFYDDGGAYIESKTFNLNYENDLVILRKYIELFEDNPEKNKIKMTSLRLRT